MTEEDSDFLTGVIEFGDGKQYTVAPAAEVESADPQPAHPSEDRLGNDYDRSWPASRENGAHANISPSSSFKGSNPPLERVLFNDRHNRMETLPQGRQPPTLLNPIPPGARGPGSRRDPNGRVFRDSPSWNPRGGLPAESLDKDSDGRSMAEKDKLGHNQGGLGPYLRDRSPDGSGRFPGRNIPVMSRRDSQASSAMVGSGPARSNRALSRESSDRGGGARQLPPHLSVVSPVIPSSATSSVPPRTSWRDSPTNARPPSLALSHARPMSMASDGSHPLPGSENEQLVSPVASNAVPPSDAAAAALAALVQDETALKAVMNVAAERARKRRQEEEEQREKERERAKQKLIELEKKMQEEKEAKEKAEQEERQKAEKEREQKEEEVRLAKLKTEKERVARERKEQPKSGVAGKERGGSNARPVPPQHPSDMVDSWRTARPPLSTNISSSQLDPESKRSPTTILKSKIHDASPTAAQMPNRKPSVDLSGKPANAALIPEFAALRSKDHDVEVLDFADLHQLAEGYMQSQLETKATTHVNGFETTNKPHASAHIDDSKGFTRAEGKYSRSQPPAPLNLVPRGSQDQSQSQGPHSASHGPGSAGLGSARSSRNADPNHSAYRQAPISVLDDTLSRFKTALEHSNPAHAGMSSDDIMLGLGRVSADVGKVSFNQPPSGMMVLLYFLWQLLISSRSVHVSMAAMFSKEIDEVTNEPAWSQTQLREIEEADTPSVLIPTLSVPRKPIPYYKTQAIKHVQAWRWDCLTFDPPVQFMNRRTLSVMDALVERPTNSAGRLRIKIPGSSLRSVPYGDSSQRSASRLNRQRREDLRTNAPPILQPTTNGIVTPPKTAPSSSQWPPKSKGAEDAVWRRAVPVTAIPEQAPSASTLKADTPSTPLTSKSVPDAKHNRTLVSIYRIWRKFIGY
jgi:serine/arginine repetitive matrix protein 2